ncbi:unnamed protein product [Prunus armeniaca]|uniref:Uncharacterized protein n=1 Tax=Prunus armeniaca TaxID=36596 RepID=A0A6J5XNB9_PRUAR|nr:unnamed protein product [Prunus armeniaca]
MATGQMMRHGWTSGNTGAILEPALDNWNDVLELWEMNGMRDKVFSDERGIGEVWGTAGLVVIVRKVVLAGWGCGDE